MASGKKLALIRKSKEKATKYVQKGNFEKALDEYRTLVKLDPDDLRFRLKLGECLAKLGRKKDAIEEYKRVLDRNAEKGFLIQAVAVGKVILQLDPSLKEVEDRIAELNARRGIVTERKRVLRPALSLKGIEGPIPTAVREEKVPGEVREERAVAGEREKGSASQLYPEKEIIEEEKTGWLEKKEEDEQVREGGPIPLDEAPEDMEEVEAPPPRSEFPPMPETPLFSDLNVDEFKRVMQKFQIGNLPKGITVVKEGSRGDSFYIVAEGKVRVYKWSKNKKRKLTLSVLEGGAFFGEFAFLTNSIRSASVETMEDCVLLRINRKDLEDIIREYPRVREVIDEFYRKRVVDTLLKISPLFSGMDEADRREVIKRFESVQLDTGDVIIREGDEGKALYMVKHGAIQVSKKHPETGEEIKLAVLREGDFFGEISLLQNVPTTADCTALVPTDLFRLPKPAFQELVMMNPQILEKVSTTADERMRSTRKSLTARQADRQSSGLL